MPSLDTGTDEDRADSLRKNLAKHAREIHWPRQVIWRIEPARVALIQEHFPSRIDLSFLVDNNPFIPEGHEGIYLRGIQAGFSGDWLVAMHLLIPQLEASIRYVLQQHDEITSTMRDGIQQEQDINQLLTRPEVLEIFGADLIFDLRGILIERFGHNLRNDLAHALIPEGGFYQPASVYFWWLCIRLCWTGFWSKRQPVSDDTSSQDSA